MSRGQETSEETLHIMASDDGHGPQWTKGSHVAALGDGLFGGVRPQEKGGLILRYSWNMGKCWCFLLR